jgi:hypothetical protein
MNKNVLIGWLAAAFLAILLPGCSPVARPAQVLREKWFELDPNNRVGQSFVANFDGLSAIDLYLDPGAEQIGDISLYLKKKAQDKNVLASSSLDQGSFHGPGYYRFIFPPLDNSSQENYYLELSLSGNHPVMVGTAAAGTYLNGAMYSKEIPQDAQLTFLLAYNPLQVGLGLLREVTHWLFFLLVTFFLYVLPGWGLGSWLWKGWKLSHWTLRLGLAAGISLAVYPLIFLWTDLVGLHLGKLYAWLPPLVGLGLILWQNRHRLSEKPIFRGTWQRPEATSLAFIFLLSLIIFSRFWAARTLVAPLWGDSYQHSLIVKLILDHGGLFQSWQPYSSLETFSYHFGFHSSTAVFAWLTGQTAAEAVLWFGQILNVLAVLALYPLAVMVGKNRWAGIIALLVAGLVLQMPAYYLNWGRFTQLAGQAILPVCVFMAWKLLEEVNLDWKLLGLNCILAAGLALSHYRVVIFAVLFLPAYWLLNIRRNNFRPAARNTLLYGVGAGILFLPQVINLAGGNILNILKSQLSTSAGAVSAWQLEYNAFGDLSTFLPHLVWILMILSAAWLLWKHSRPAAVISLWWLLNLLATNPGWLGLPGTGMISNFALMIAAYLPAALLLGAAFSQLPLWRQTQKPTQPGEGSRITIKTLGSAILVAAFLGLAVWGVFQRMDEADPGLFALVTKPDIQAANWLAQNTPGEARFLVNGFSSFNGQAIAGSDAGWWLPLLAGRQTFINPLNSTFEQSRGTGNQPDAEIIHLIEANGVDDPQLLAMYQAQGLTHVYIGQRRGQVNDSTPLLNVDDLLHSPHYKPIYNQDLVWVFAIQP